MRKLSNYEKSQLDFCRLLTFVDTSVRELLRLCWEVAKFWRDL